MKKLLLGAFALVGVLAIIVAFIALLFLVSSVAGKGSVPTKTLLEVNLEEGLVEYVPEDPIAKLMLGDTPTVRDVVEALEKASGDDRVVGLIARIGAGGMGLAQAQEIRDAVISFRAKGKRAIAFAETFGEFGPGNVGYYVATGFDEIYLQPSGDIGLTGLMAESPFLKGTLDKLGIVPRMDHRYEYKNAMNIFTETKYTDAHREATKKVVDSMFGQMVRGIAQGRRLSEDEARGLFDRGPFLGQEAVAAKLVDGLAYRDEVYGKAKQKAGGAAKLLYLAKYLDRAGRPHAKGETIALIYGVGGVGRGESGYDPMFGTPSMGSDTVAAAFRAAVDDTAVKAILFRVDSPGGSYVASDTIYRETLRAKEAGKPVIVSMGDVAGSGGYFVAMGADKIVAQPGTITGSIGVLGGKMLMTGLYDKIGISFDEVHTSEPATTWSSVHDYTPEQWARFESWLDRVYEDFTSKVAKGRRLPKDRILEIAKGRIWSGEDAKALGLVDELGGFPAALRLARQSAGLPPDARIRLKVFPREKSAWETVMQKRPDSSDKRAFATILQRFIRMARPVAVLAERLGFATRDDSAVLAMPSPPAVR